MWYTSAFFANSRRKCFIDSLVKGLILGLKSRAEFLSFFSPISRNLAFSLLNLSFFSWLKRFFALVAVSSIFLAAQGVEANFSWKMKAFQPLLGFQYREPFSAKIHPSPFNRKVLKTVRVQAHAGSNPALPATKETSFVYQDMRGFLFVWKIHDFVV